MQNPRERILLTDMMRHPWVTMDGRFPLKCHRELKKGESNEDHDMLPERRTFAQCNPKVGPTPWLPPLAGTPLSVTAPPSRPVRAVSLNSLPPPFLPLLALPRQDQPDGLPVGCWIS